MNLSTTSMKRFATLLLIGGMALSLSACSDFLDVNEDPNAATRESVTNPGLVFIEAQTALASNKVMEIVGQSSVAQTWSAINGTFIPAENYNPSTFTTGNTYLGNYTTTAGNLTEVINIAEAADPEAVSYSPDNVIAQAELFRQYTYLYVTTQFGPAAYSQANRFEQFPEPELDPQENILRGIVANVDSAISRIDPSAGPGIEDRDLFYSGDLKKWERFGNSLKLRAYMLLLSGEDGNAQADGALGATLEEEINNLLDNEPLIRSNTDNATFPFSDAEGNENNFFQLSQDFSFDGDGDGLNDNLWFACSVPIVQQMSSLNDPRLSTYCAEAAGGGFQGVEQGTTDPGTEASVISTAIHRPEYPEKFLTAAEVLLKEAEWEYRQGNPSEARQKLIDGIRASINFFDEKPGAIDETAEDAYINNQVPSTGALTLEDIQLQQWIDLFERNPEAWTHWRRTKVPNLSPPSTAALETIARRYPYPPDAVTANPNVSQQNPSEPMWFEGSN